jgi:hypothetical protein
MPRTLDHRADGPAQDRRPRRAGQAGQTVARQLEQPADLLAELSDADDGSGPPPDPEQMIAAAWRQAGRAVAFGQIAEARAWTRLVRDLRALAPPKPDKPDGPDSNFSSPVSL